MTRGVPLFVLVFAACLGSALGMLSLAQGALHATSQLLGVSAAIIGSLAATAGLWLGSRQPQVWRVVGAFLVVVVVPVVATVVVPLLVLLVLGLFVLPQSTGQVLGVASALAGVSTAVWLHHLGVLGPWRAVLLAGLSALGMLPLLSASAINVGSVVEYQMAAAVGIALPVICATAAATWAAIAYVTSPSSA